MIGNILDRRYKIINSLSSGAFGHTFLAEDTKRPQNPICVVKQLKPRETHPDFLRKAKQLFDREAEALEDLNRLGKTVPSTTITPAKDRTFRFVKPKILIHKTAVLTAVMLFWWLKTRIDRTSNADLPLNGKVIDGELNEADFCQDMILESEIYC